MTVHRASLALVLALGLTGCGAREPAQTEGPTSTSAGAETAAPSDSPNRELEGGGAHGTGGPDEGGGEAEPAYEYEESLDLETMDSITAYDTLRSTETYVDQLLDGGSSGCSEAERLVRDICFLAERVCDQVGVDGEPDDDPDGAARCDEGRARCARSEARVARSCP